MKLSAELAKERRHLDVIVSAESSFATLTRDEQKEALMLIDSDCVYTRVIAKPGVNGNCSPYAWTVANLPRAKEWARYATTSRAAQFRQVVRFVVVCWGGNLHQPVPEVARWAL